jgi:ABC-2 type transport system ATP-binding protein
VATASTPQADAPESASALAIATTGLAKRFGAITAVAGVDLAIPRGVVCGFVGPNGAGKTTTIRMLLGLVRPTAGTGAVLGVPLTHAAGYLGRVGALIEGPAFYPTMTGNANLAALARLGGIDVGGIGPLLDQVGLHGHEQRQVRGYSLGMKQRLGIAAALLPDPQLLVLDEPANGLDPAGIVEIRHLLRRLADGGITVFVSSHLLAEIEQICDHLVMIRDGRLVFQGTVGALVAAQAPELLARPERPEDAGALVALVAGTGRPARLLDGTVHVSSTGDWAASLNRLAMDAGITLTHLSERKASLEEAFFRLAAPAGGGDSAGAEAR